MNTKSIEIRRIDSCIGIKIGLRNANLIVIFGERGYVMCSYLNIKTAEKLGDVACIISGVSEIDDAINARIEKISKNARRLGIREGMLVKDVLKFLS
ncbi:MAG: DUF1805 domain-containing protein [Candidatus Altiarchaeales archaeon]|nr:MAG: DUF1805 domain-containing protein [Candidatus Altiarchaeales archaeon]RLI94644.1 MAG: DUF1805 domain-containing protein [Candidatus Altiarchaeales archaeon]HDO82832.1 DUF1805 domain-containing protein [Candidatus Altiarchaeales archaeon]HEX55481.1 DUF1805 domain-containing protein [Candidatus Altiarchaeales archaeon]